MTPPHDLAAREVSKIEPAEAFENARAWDRFLRPSRLVDADVEIPRRAHGAECRVH